MSFVMTDEFSTRITKLLQALVSHDWYRHGSLLFCFQPIFNSMNYGHIIKKMQTK